jgi:hypothetical protein
MTTSRFATADLLDGAFGVDPTVVVTFDLWLDSAQRSSIDYPEQAVDLFAGGPIADLTYDPTILNVTPAASDDPFYLRRYTFTAADPAAPPTWAPITLTIGGYQAPWTIPGNDGSDPVDGIFQIRAAGINVLNTSVVTTYPNYGYGIPRTEPVYIQLAGGVVPASAKLPYRFPHSGGAIFDLRTGSTMFHPTAWNTLRLHLRDPGDELTPAKIRARAHDSIAAALSNTDALAPQRIVLGPVADGQRILDIEFPAPRFTGAARKYVAVEAPILKYLAAYQKTTPEIEYASSTTDPVFDLYYDPTSSSTTGLSASAAGLVKASDRGIVTEFHVWPGPDNVVVEPAGEYGGSRFDLLWGVPDDPTPAIYSYLPHALRNVDITINGAGKMAAGPQAQRAHFS